MDTPELDVTRWNPYDRNCPTRKLLDRIGDRWTVLIIGTLQHGPQRFGELKTRVDGISQKMLTQTLRRLEEHRKSPHGSIMNSPTWAAPSSRRSRG